MDFRPILLSSSISSPKRAKLGIVITISARYRVESAICSLPLPVMKIPRNTPRITAMIIATKIIHKWARTHSASNSGRLTMNSQAYWVVI